MQKRAELTARFAAELRIQEEIVALIEKSMSSPIFYHSGVQHYGYLYAKPTALHFCLLKAIKAVSAMHAVAVLTEEGFPHEIGVLLRTVIESNTHIDYILAGMSDGQLAEPQKEFIESYFADYRRNQPSDFKRPAPRQKDLNKIIGRRMNEEIAKLPTAAKFKGVEAEQLYSNIYLTYSNYVHGRYPEIMDLYGGTPGRFHVRGMAGTPKDNENVAQLEAYIESVSNTLRKILQIFQLTDKLSAEIRSWYHFRESDRLASNVS